MNAYTTLRGEGKGIYEEKKSSFIGVAMHIENESDALARIRKIKSENYDARHNVFAYVCEDGRVQRYSDDGEPQGTAGIPVLDVIRKSGLSDVCVVVTRYFGGILLGAGGLVRAYTAAAKAAIDDAGTVSFEEYAELSLTLNYAEYQKLLPKLSRFEVKTDDTAFGAEVELRLALPCRQEAGFLRFVGETFCNRIVIERRGTRLDRGE